MITYTPDQQLLFDQDPAHWVRKPGGWHLHISGVRLRLVEEGSENTIWYRHMIYNDCDQMVASINFRDQKEFRTGMPGLLMLLQTVFSEARRALLQEFIDHAAFLLLNQGGKGKYLVQMHENEDHRAVLCCFDEHKQKVVVTLPDSVRCMAERLTWTPARESMDSTILVSRDQPLHLVVLPLSSHALMEHRLRLRDTYAWARDVVPC